MIQENLDPVIDVKVKVPSARKFVFPETDSYPHTLELGSILNEIAVGWECNLLEPCTPKVDFECLPAHNSVRIRIVCATRHDALNQHTPDVRGIDGVPEVESERGMQYPAPHRSGQFDG